MELTLDQKLDKLRKLLAKTKKNPSQEEAQSVLLLAQRLMIKWHIDMAEVDAGSKAEEVIEVNIWGRHSVWKEWLACLIASNFRCIGIISKYDRSKAVTFIGLKADVAIVAEVYKSAVLAIESGANRCYRQLKDKLRRTKGIKGDYITGFLIGLDQKFKEQVKKSGWGLVLVRDQAVDDFVAQKNIRKSLKSKPLNMQKNQEALTIGFKDGKAFKSSGKNLELFEISQ